LAKKEFHEEKQKSTYSTEKVYGSSRGTLRGGGALNSCDCDYWLSSEKTTMGMVKIISGGKGRKTKRGEGRRDRRKENKESMGHTWQLLILFNGGGGLERKL